MSLGAENDGCPDVLLKPSKTDMFSQAGGVTAVSGLCNTFVPDTEYNNLQKLILLRVNRSISLINIKLLFNANYPVTRRNAMSHKRHAGLPGHCKNVMRANLAVGNGYQLGERYRELFQGHCVVLGVFDSV